MANSWYDVMVWDIYHLYMPLIKWLWQSSTLLWCMAWYLKILILSCIPSWFLLTWYIHQTDYYVIHKLIHDQFFFKSIDNWWLIAKFGQMNCRSRHTFYLDDSILLDSDCYFVGIEVSDSTSKMHPFNRNPKDVPQEFFCWKGNQDTSSF